MVVIPRPFLELIQDDPLTGDLYIHSLGHIPRARHHHISRPAGSPYHVFLYCTDGKGTVNSNGTEFSLTANRYMVLPAGVPFSYYADDADPWSLYWIVFGGDKAVVFSNAMSKPRTAQPSVHSRIEQRTELFDTVHSLLCGGLTLPKINYANVIVMHFLTSFLYLNLDRGPTPQREHGDNMVAKVTHFMNENIEKNLTLKDLSAIAGYSGNYFYRKFFRETGHGPIDYFIRLKMNKASILLIKTRLRISQIAGKLGFASADYFSRMFKKTVGISPTEFRRQNFRL